MVRSRCHRMVPRWAAMLLVASLVLAAEGLRSGLLASDVIRPFSDEEQPTREPESWKSLAPARRPADSFSSPSERSRWNKLVSSPQRNRGLEKGVEAQSTKPAEPTTRGTDGSENQVANATGPVIVGRVLYHGTVPPPTQEQVTRDVEVCGPTINVVPLSVNPTTHGVRDAIVHVGVGQEAMHDVPVQVSVVKNHRCAFYPRVAALQAGAQTEISNDDPLMHNTNISVNARTVLNVALVAGGNPIRKPLKMEGLHLIKCNIHKFMNAYRYVFSDPYFDQTNDSGQFLIQGVPPGLHAMSVRHETLGVLHKEIQVPVRGTVTVDFEFK